MLLLPGQLLSRSNLFHVLLLLFRRGTGVDLVEFVPGALNGVHDPLFDVTSHPLQSVFQLWKARQGPSTACKVLSWLKTFHQFFHDNSTCQHWTLIAINREKKLSFTFPMQKPWQLMKEHCTINSKINGTPKGVYLPIYKLHSILTVANLLTHNNLWLCYYGQVNSLRLK